MDHLALLEGEVAAMAAALRATPADRPVTSCPGWDVAALTAHITGVHRWVLAALENNGSPAWDDTSPAPPDDYAAAATAMVARLHALAPDAPVWTFNEADRTAGFWRRRQLQEVSVHRWDVDAHAIDPEIAADGVDEVVTFWLPRLLSRGYASLPEGRLVLDTGARSWTLTEGAGPQAVVTADAATIDLLLWGRRALDDSVVTGDTAFASAVFAAVLTP